MKKSDDKENQFYEMNRKNMEDLCQSNLDIFRDLIDIEFKYSNIWQEYLNAQVERLSTAKEISDVIAIESGLATEYTNKFSETNRRLFETVSDAMQKQMECLNLPTDVENLLPSFQEYSKILNTATKNSKPVRSSRK